MIFGEKLLNAKQLAERLNVSMGFLYKLKKQGLPSHTIGGEGRAYYDYDEVVAWLYDSGFRPETRTDWTR
jgi:phage terminase Nu1 subunit (DNA packaging protein)